MHFRHFQESHVRAFPWRIDLQPASTRLYQLHAWSACSPETSKKTGLVWNEWRRPVSESTAGRFCCLMLVQVVLFDLPFHGFGVSTLQLGQEITMQSL